MISKTNCKKIQAAAKAGGIFSRATKVNSLLTETSVNQIAAINYAHREQKMKLTPISLLYDLVNRGGCSTPTELSTSFPYTKQAMTVALRDLEKNGYIEITQDSADRRVKKVCLTEQGIEFINNSIKIRTHFYEGFVDTLSPEEIEELIRLLDKVNRFYKATAQGAYDTTI